MIAPSSGNSVEKYLGAIEEHGPDILGMSALLTTTMPYMKVVIDTMKEKDMRDDYIVLVGGAPLNEEFAKAIGADAYCRDAAVAVETAKSYMARKHNQLAKGYIDPDNNSETCLRSLYEQTFCGLEATSPLTQSRHWPP